MTEYDFIGYYSHSIDSKKRVAIPAKYRSQIKDGKVIVTKFLDGCLVVYPADEWEKLKAEKLSKLDPMASRDDRDKKRVLLGSAIPCEVDKQGRIGLTVRHLKQAKISKEVVFTGMGNYFEIWSAGEWDAWEEAYNERERAGQ